MTVYELFKNGGKKGPIFLLRANQIIFIGIM
jgi:hypothetical protein